MNNNEKILDLGFKWLNEKNVDADGNYVKYSKMEERFNGLTTMSEGLTEMKSLLLDTINRINKAQAAINMKLTTGELQVTDKDRNNLFHDVEEAVTDINQFAKEPADVVEQGWFEFFNNDQETEKRHDLVQD